MDFEAAKLLRPWRLAMFWEATCQHSYLKTLLPDFVRPCSFVEAISRILYIESLCAQLQDSLSWYDRATFDFDQIWCCEYSLIPRKLCAWTNVASEREKLNNPCLFRPDIFKMFPHLDEMIYRYGLVVGE